MLVLLLSMSLGFFHRSRSRRLAVPFLPSFPKNLYLKDGRAHAAPAHCRGVHSRGVFSICRSSSLTSLWLWPIGRASSWDAGSSVVGDLLGRRSRLLP